MPMPIQAETNISAVVRSLRELWLLAQNLPPAVAASVKSVGVQAFTASGTYTPTPGMVFCLIRCQAPGGGSGGADSDGSTAVASSGGGAGEYAEGLFTAAQIGASQAITIGAQGAAGSNTGGNGGNVSVGALISANGGLGGTGTGSNSNSSAPRAGGAGGTGGTGGHLRIPGQAGESSDRVTDNATFTLIKRGKGGDSVLGRAVPAGPFQGNASVAASAGPNYGAGATGAQHNTTSGITGALGGAGIVQIVEFIAS